MKAVLQKVVLLFCWLVAVIPSFKSLVSGEVHQLFSSLDTTKRNHACASELVTFECETTGSMLIWTTDLHGGNRVIFFSDDRVDTVRVTQRQTTRAILLRNDPAPEGNSMRRLTSVLLLSTDSSMNSIINVTCSSNTETASKVFGIAATPGPPRIPDVVFLQQANNARLNDSLIYVKWREPLNADLFDLQHYSVQATMQGHSDPLYAGNVTSTEFLIRLGLSSIPTKLNVVVSITAVSSCSERKGQPVIISKYNDDRPFQLNSNIILERSSGGSKAETNLVFLVTLECIVLGLSAVFMKINVL